jgi:NtrC-family two-component system sensor histidine kinase KinB
LEFTESAPLRCEDIFSDSGVCELIHSTIETGIPPTIPDEQRIISIPEGERTLHYLFSVTAVRGRDRNLTGIILLLRNVTRLKEVEQLKNEFVTAASHELRTPRPAWG